MTTLPEQLGGVDADVKHSRHARRAPPLAAALFGLLIGSLPAIAAAPAHAQDREVGYSRLPAFGRSIVYNDDTTALVVNPATLAFMPEPELRWTSVYLQHDAEVPWQGHSIGFGFPISILSMATGLRLDLVDPPGDEGFVSRPAQHNYQWLTWGLALRSGDSAGVGMSLQRSYSEGAPADGLASWSLGFLSRPWNALGLAFVANHINYPRNSAGGLVERSYDVGFALRPLGTRTLELGLEARYVDVPFGFWVPRATLGVDIAPLGRVRADFSVSDPEWDGGEDVLRGVWTASAALAIYINTPTGSTELSGGSVLGNVLGEEAELKPASNVQTEVALKGWREPAGPSVPRYAFRLRLEDTPSRREHVRLLRQLWRLADEPTLDAVLLELRTNPAGSLAHAQELRDALEHLRRHGKRVLCHLEDARGLALYTCAAADRILMNPAGGLRFSGLSTKTFYYASLLKKLGIRADFVRLGPHKSAPESFMRDSGSQIAQQDKIDLLQQYERQIVEGIAGGRQLAVDEVRRRIAQGPFVAPEAKQAGLIDGYAFDDQLEQELAKLVGWKVLVVDEPARVAPKHAGGTRRVALIHAYGNLIDGRSQTIPLLGMNLLGSYSMAETLKQIREDPSIAAVVLRIDSPGGSGMASDVLWREVQLTARHKPVIVSMGSVAASGGYYVAAAGTRIYANPLTLTGSIGVYYGKADVAQLMKKIGVSVEVYKTAPRADIESIFRPFSTDEKRVLKRKVRQFYETFLSRVVLSRKLKREEVTASPRGECGPASKPRRAGSSMSWAGCARPWPTPALRLGFLTTPPSSSCHPRSTHCSVRSWVWRACGHQRALLPTSRRSWRTWSERWHRSSSTPATSPWRSWN